MAFTTPMFMKTHNCSVELHADLPDRSRNLEGMSRN